MRGVGTVAIAVAIGALTATSVAWASIDGGPFVSFVAESRPEPPLDKFLAGQLGLIEPSWNTDSLYVVYRSLAGPGFDAAEQKVLVDFFTQPAGPQPSILPGMGWISARARILDAPELDLFDVYAPAGELDSYGNCNDDALLTATATLQSMVAKFGKSSSQVKEWLAAQDVVFENCPGSKAHAHIPEPLKGGTPFEQAQRAYQIASANFYGEEFDTAISQFNAIAADANSPWRTIAPYLAARATIRKATLSGDTNDPALLALAAQRLKAIVAGNAPDSIKAAAQRLLGFVGCRLHPDQTHADLARALMRANSARTLAQDLHDFGVCGTAPREKDHAVDDLDDWIENFQSVLRSGIRGQADRINSPESPRDTSYLFGKWKRTGSVAWLVAALSQASGTDPNAGPLLEAARRVKPGAPAYLTVEFQADRILIQQDKADEARDRIDAILANRAALGRSAYNEFASMRLKLARNQNDFLKYALRYPVALEGEEYTSTRSRGKDLYRYPSVRNWNRCSARGRCWAMTPRKSWTHGYRSAC